MSKELISSVLDKVNKARKAVGESSISELPQGDHTGTSCPIAKAIGITNIVIRHSHIYTDELYANAIATAWGTKAVKLNPGSQLSFYPLATHWINNPIDIQDFVRIYDNGQLPEYELDK